MNADLQKLKDSRLFVHLPDRAFERLLKYIKVQAFDRAETVCDFSKGAGPFQRHFGYVLRGRVAFLDTEYTPLGIAVRDEFFLGKPFTIEERKVLRLASAHSQTLVVWIPKQVIEVLASNSDQFAELIEEIYDSIFERAQLISKDSTAGKTFSDWSTSMDPDKTLDSWLGALEKKRQQAQKKILDQRLEKRRSKILWLAGIFIFGFCFIESLGRFLQIPINPSFYLGFGYGPYDPGSDYNIALGIVGFSFVLLTNAHTFSKFAIRKFKWKINYKFSSHLHMFFGLTGAGLILLHCAFHFSGVNVAHLALYALFVGTASGIVGQVISNQIPKTIRGEKMKLDNLKEEQARIRRKAELLMDDSQMKTSVLILNNEFARTNDERSFWLTLLLTPFSWWRMRGFRKALQKVGLGADSARLGAQLLRQEINIQRSIKFWQAANSIFKRWMIFHIPLGYAVYFLGIIHVIVAMFLA